MANMQLKNCMLEAVENQLRLNEPKCTKETFERLVASGTEQKRAKEMIAAVLIEEMYYVLKNKEPFNEQRYAHRLSELRKDSLVEDDNTYESFDMQANNYNEENTEDVYINAQPVVKDFKTGRNDPCPCGSGKKYKKCCG